MDTNEKAILFDLLRSLMGYVEDGSDTTVSLCQDDATRYYVCTVGKKSYYGESLKQAIEAAINV